MKPRPSSDETRGERRPVQKSGAMEKPPAVPAPAVAPTAGGGSVLVRWFLSKTVRHAVAMRKHVIKLLNHQRDLLTPQAVEAVAAGAAELRQAIVSKADRAELEKEMQRLETTANKWLKPYPNATWRENVEVLLVALAVAMGIRTFFLQPFKIPTGSMQPTLYGVMSTNLINVPDYKFPTGLERVKQWFAGVSYVHVVAENDGQLGPIEPPLRILIFNIKQTLYIGGKAHTIWFPPDYGAVTLQARANIDSGQFFRQGQDVVKMSTIAGDHLFVDRMSYNFRSPKRGEIIVFETKGIEKLPQDQFYIKRMVAMGGERVQIGQDRHLIINGRRLEGSTPHFEKVYSFGPEDPPRESQYSGHVDGPTYAPLFYDKPDGMTVAPGHYMVMGDNTMNSYDSRYWGDFPATNVIGKSFFVYWPITDRFGSGYHR
jgi:signal peptidase I